MQYILNRMKEPSTWAAFTALGVLFGLDPAKAHALEGVGIAAAGALAVFLPEKAGA